MLFIKKVRLNFQNLQSKILIFTFGASLVPVILLSSLAWRLITDRLFAMEQARLRDQVSAFNGYLYATKKGMEDVTNGYTQWTLFYEALERRDLAWMKEQVTLGILSTSKNADAVEIISRKGEIFGEKNEILQPPGVRKQINQLIATGKQVEVLMESDRHLLIISIAPITKDDGSGRSSGTLVVAQILDDGWLRNFLKFSQSSTQLDLFSLQGEPIITSKSSLWNRSNVTKAVQENKPIYEIKLDSKFNTVYAPLLNQQQPAAVISIHLSSQYLNQATNILKRQIWLGSLIAIVLSIVLAHLLSKQIAEPINRLAKRSKTLADGDLSSPIPDVSGGELGQLAKAFQEMARSLQGMINTLEFKVEERTQELEYSRQQIEHQAIFLLQKNQQLQDAYDQLKQTQSQLIQTEKMSSLGQMVAGVSHEINNPISFIHGNLDYTSSYVKDLIDLISLYQEHYQHQNEVIAAKIEEIDLEFILNDLPKAIASMKTGSNRIYEIVLSLRNFSRLDESEMKVANIHEGLDNTLLLLHHRIKNRIKIIKTYKNIPEVECYPGQLNQVFMNLLSNAIDALEDKIKVDRNFSKEATILISTEAIHSPSESCILVRVLDNGGGVPESAIDKLFEPFFTTKPVGQGTGLGLAISYQIIVEKHKGSIGCKSEVGKGTEFIVKVPIQRTNSTSLVEAFKSLTSS